MRFFPLGALVAAFCLVLPGCGNSADQQGQAMAIPVTATTPQDPFAVPEVIDAAYVDKVLAAIWRTRDSATQAIATTHTFTAEDEARLSAIYRGDLLENQLVVFQRAADQVWDDSYKVSTTVAITQRIGKADDGCIWAEAQTTGVGGSTLQSYVMERADKSPLNPTGWIITQNSLPELTDENSTC